MSHKSRYVGWLLIVCAYTPGLVQAQDTFLGKNADAWLAELENGNDSARRGAAFALGKLGAGAALNPLQKRLQNDKDVWVREAAAIALGEIGRSTSNDQLLPVLAAALGGDASPVVRRSAAVALGYMGVNALPVLQNLEAAMKDESPLVRQNVAWALAKLGAKAIPALKQALHDTDALVKRDAAMSMEPLDAAALRPLLPDLAGLCREERSDVRRAALGVLIKVVTPLDIRFIRQIALCLKDGDEEVRNYAALTLANIGGKESAQAVPQLLHALRQQRSQELRRQAAVGIRNIGSAAKEAVPDLILALKDQDDEIRANAALALGGIAEEAVAAYEALLQRVEDSTEKDDTRIKASFALAKINQCPDAKKAVPRILKVLGDPKEPGSVRGRVIWALRVHDLGDLRKMKGVSPTLYKVLAEGKTVDNKMLRYDCAYMLGFLQRGEVQAEVLQTLLDFLQDENVQIFVGVQSSVGGVGNEAGSGKSKVSEGGRGDGRVMAAQALTAIGPARLVDQREIIKQLHTLAENPVIFEDLRKLSADLLKSMKK